MTARAEPGLLADITSALKLRIALAIAFTGVAGLLATPGPMPPAWKVVLLGVTLFLASASAGGFNQIIERDIDAIMLRTRKRPFVRGAFQAGPVWYGIVLGLLAGAVGAAAIWLGAVAALHVFMGAFVYAIVYTVWLKRRTSWNIVIGGLAGSFAVLAGGAVIDPWPGAVPLLLAAALFFWTPPHFWSLAMARRDDYAAAGVPMLPSVVGAPTAAKAILGNTVVLVAASLAPVWFGLGWIYAATAAAGGALFLWRAMNLLREPGAAAAMPVFRASLLQLSLLLLGAMLDRIVGV